MKYWINTVSKDHLQRGIAGGFTQANHGKATVLKRLQKGDYIIFYSPKTAYQDGEPLQAFTAVCRVTDSEPYQVEMSPDFHPFRRNVVFLSAQETPIKPLIDDLEFIQDKTRWGYKFRFGLFEINEHDFNLIAQATYAQL
ncbi:MAG TPA: EVE domain-containing protein [Candidatus Saccharimonadales bacterium]|nr:EVE domain-containing protein [Candidatus Saccharimonadales bacterium]